MEPVTRFKELLQHFEEAVEEHSVIGAHYPEDWPKINGEYRSAKRSIINYVRQLTTSKQKEDSKWQ